jgi:glycosyltransferase involved in cell wall biosynthesis
MATLSVVLTNYNHSKEIGRAIECIVKQSRLPDEFVIQDDGSTDNSVEIISSYVEKYPFVKFYKNDINLGPIQAMRKVLQYASCDYVYGAGADDWVLPGFFEKAMNMVETYPQAGMCCGDMIDYIAATGLTSEYNMLWSDKTEYFVPEKIVDLLAGRSIPGQAGIIRRDALIEAGGFIPELKWHSDWFFNHVVAFRYGIVYTPQYFAVETAGSPGSFCYEGSKNSVLQEDVLINAIRLLKSTRYRDVLPYFIRSAAFFPFSIDAVRAVMRKKEFWDIETLLLLQHSLFCWNTNMAAKRNQRAQKSAENSIAGLLKKVEMLIDRGKIKEAESFLDEIEKKFGSIQGIKMLREKINKTYHD